MEVLLRYSSAARRAKPFKLPEISGAAPASVGRRHEKSRVEDRIDVDALIQEYVEGASTRQLMASYGIAKGTVLRLLDERGVTRQRRRFSADDAAEAVHLYKSGLSIEAVAERLGFSGKTVWTALQSAGVALRDAQGRER